MMCVQFLRDFKKFCSTLKQHKIEQQSCFKYFCASGFREFILLCLLLSQYSGDFRRISIFLSRNPQYVPTALKLFEAKILLQFLYRTAAISIAKWHTHGTSLFMIVFLSHGNPSQLPLLTKDYLYSLKLGTFYLVVQDTPT